MFEHLNFGKIGFKTSVFEKHFISYSCILFIKDYALRSFYRKLLCFFKKLFFPEFRSSELVSRPIKIAIKILARPCVFRLMLDWCSINWSTFNRSNLFFQPVESRIESFLKPLFLMCFVTFKLFKKLFSLSIQSVQVS